MKKEHGLLAVAALAGLLWVIKKEGLGMNTISDIPTTEDLLKAGTASELSTMWNKIEQAYGKGLLDTKLYQELNTTRVGAVKRFLDCKYPYEACWTEDKGFYCCVPQEEPDLV